MSALFDLADYGAAAGDDPGAAVSPPSAVPDASTSPAETQAQGGAPGHIAHYVRPRSMTCLQCAGDLEWLTGGTSSGRETACMLRCTECGGEHLLTVRLTLDQRTCRTPARRAQLARARSRA